MFQMYVASVTYGCCKSRSGCCICYNGCACMLQACVHNVSSVFSDVCCKCVYLDVADVFHTYIISVLSKCCICCTSDTHVASVCFKCFYCFKRMLQVFYLDVAKVDLDVTYTCMLQAYV